MYGACYSAQTAHKLFLTSFANIIFQRNLKLNTHFGNSKKREIKLILTFIANFFLSYLNHLVRTILGSWRLFDRCSLDHQIPTVKFLFDWIRFKTISYLSVFTFHALIIRIKSIETFHTGYFLLFRQRLVKAVLGQRLLSWNLEFWSLITAWLESVRICRRIWRIKRIFVMIFKDKTFGTLILFFLWYRIILWIKFIAFF